MGKATVNDQGSNESNAAPETANPTVNAIAGGTILACVVLILVLSLGDTPGSPHGASLALIVGGGVLSALAIFYQARRGRRTQRGR